MVSRASVLAGLATLWVASMFVNRVPLPRRVVRVVVHPRLFYGLLLRVPHLSLLAVRLVTVRASLCSVVWLSGPRPYVWQAT